jgi:hypothetical protein
MHQKHPVVQCALQLHSSAKCVYSTGYVCVCTEAALYGVTQSMSNAGVYCYCQLFTQAQCVLCALYLDL